MSETSSSRVSFWVPLLISWAVIITAWGLTPNFVAWRVAASKEAPSAAENATLDSINSKESEEDLTAGTYGDQFGSVNALFSGMALATIAISLWYQRRDIENQRQDIKLQQDALLAQQGIFERQLRFATVTEVVASLPTFDFQVDSEDKFQRRFSFVNRGAQIYDLQIMIPHRNSVTQLTPIPYKPGELMDYHFTYRIPTDNLSDPPSVVCFELRFNLRNGERVTYNYSHDSTMHLVIPGFVLKSKIEEVLNKVMPPTPVSKR